MTKTAQRLKNVLIPKFSFPITVQFYIWKTSLVYMLSFEPLLAFCLCVFPGKNKNTEENYGEKSSHASYALKLQEQQQHLSVPTTRCNRQSQTMFTWRQFSGKSELRWCFIIDLFCIQFLYHDLLKVNIYSCKFVINSYRDFLTKLILFYR